MSARAAAVATAALVGLCIPALTAPRASTAPAPSHAATVVVAHRGASAEAPENTLAAVDRAAALGAEWVENDVQRTRDGVLVVLHDTDLRRTTNAEEVYPGRSPWRVKDFTAAEIGRLDAGAWKGPGWAGTRIPTLDAYLDRVEANRQSLLLEIKSPALYPGVEGDILKLLGRKGWLDTGHVAHRLIVQSFDAGSVRAVHKARPDIKTGLLGSPPADKIADYASFADQVNPDVGTLSASYVSAVHAVKGAHGRPLEVFTWAVDDARTARRVAGYGVDGIITDRPDVVDRALGKQPAPTA
ncbi:glycerophosphodiester phosphodiesterase [Streptomyces sp. NPDC050560]|uniref:glycerophosphodiester phosphodiesterase n=1 Tax=Streptomyces sp. NPDC050560 TaxID=3365630 RepID=UPI0037899AD5